MEQIITKERMVELAQAQLDAYNKRDLEAFLKCYHPNVQVYRVNQNDNICDNFEKFRQMYKDRFERNPELYCELRNRTVLENTVLDEEWVTGGGPAPSHVVAIYGFKDNLISHVWFVR